MIDMRRIKLFGIGAAAAPLIALVGVRMMSDNGPVSASADTLAGAEGAMTGSAKDQPLTDEQRIAVTYARTISGKAIVSTPFYYPPARVIDATPTDPTTPNNEPVQLDRFEVRLTSVIGGNRPLAVINGRARQIGEVVGGEWTLTAIDARAGSITLRHADGRIKSISVNQPGVGHTGPPNPYSPPLAEPRGRP